MISNELLDEIISLSNKDKFINKKIIIKALEEVLNYFGHEKSKKFNGLIFTGLSTKGDMRGLFSPETNQIFLDINRTYKDVLKLAPNKLGSNLDIIGILFHELEHFKEQFKVKENNFEAKLIKLSDITDEKLYENLYDCVPIEKLAYANSFEILLNNILNYPNFKENNFETYKYINNQYISLLKLGYIYVESIEKYNIPLFEFLQASKKLNKLNELIKLKKADETNKNKLSLENKFKYGLPVNKEDVEELNKRKILTKNTI